MKTKPAIESTTIKRDQLTQACEALGIDASQVARVHIFPDEIYVSTFSLDNEDCRILAEGDDASGFEKTSIILKVV